MRLVNPVKEVHHIGLMGENLAAFLNTLKTLEPAQFKGVEKALKTLIPRITSIEVEPNQIGEVELRLKEDGVSVPARLLSEGTLRMLGLLAVGGAKEPPTMIAFEEPENGVHPRRIELIGRFLETRSKEGKTQFIVTTHAPKLLDELPNESLFVCSRSGSQTKIVPFVKNDLGELFRDKQIQEGLLDSVEAGSRVSDQIMRGDFDV
jgi:predicted ATPase